MVYVAKPRTYDMESKERPQTIKPISPSQISIDTSSFFITKQEFISREEAVEWTRKAGRDHGVVVTIIRSDISSCKRSPRVTFGCERSGGYRIRGNERIPDVKRRRSVIKKCGCPFKLRVSLVNKAEQMWGLRVINGSHNHGLVVNFEGHSYMDSLHKDEEGIMEGVSVSGVEAFQTVTTPQKLELKKQFQQISNPSGTSLLEPREKLYFRGRKRKKKKVKKYTKSIVDSTQPSEFDYVFEPLQIEQAVSAEGLQASVQGLLAVENILRQTLKVHRTRHSNKMTWLIQFPEALRPFINKIIDVPGDGHCGYRVVAGFFGLHNDGWKQVRNDLILELEQHSADYERIMYTPDRVSEVIGTLRCWDTNVDDKYWMSMPDMGNVIASCYNVIVVLISCQQCLTFLPLRGPTPTKEEHRILGFGYINRSHFVRLDFTVDAPLPPVSTMWHRYHHTLAEAWLTPYVCRIEHFTSIMQSCNPHVAIVDIPDDVV